MKQFSARSHSRLLQIRYSSPQNVLLRIHHLGTEMIGWSIIWTQKALHEVFMPSGATSSLASPREDTRQTLGLLPMQIEAPCPAKSKIPLWPNPAIVCYLIFQGKHGDLFRPSHRIIRYYFAFEYCHSQYCRCYRGRSRYPTECVSSLRKFRSKLVGKSTKNASAPHTIVWIDVSS
jgi:hypothetical protein